MSTQGGAALCPGLTCCRPFRAIPGLGTMTSYQGHGSFSPRRGLNKSVYFSPRRGLNKSVYFSPRRGLNKSAQGRAKRRQTRSAALGHHDHRHEALKGRNNALRVYLSTAFRRSCDYAPCQGSSPPHRGRLPHPDGYQDGSERVRIGTRRLGVDTTLAERQL